MPPNGGRGSASAVAPAGSVPVVPDRAQATRGNEGTQRPSAGQSSQPPASVALAFGVGHDPLPGDEMPADVIAESNRQPTLAGRKAILEAAIEKREADNHDNAGRFIGDYGKALIELWSKNVSEEMAEAAEEAGLSSLQAVLKFVVLETLKIAVTTYFTGGTLRIFEEVAIKLREDVVEHVFEVPLTAVGERVGESVDEKVKNAQVRDKKHELDQVTDRLADYFRTLSVDTLHALPSIGPYAFWLGSATPADLPRLRLPPLFPEVPTELIRATVAGVIIGELHKFAAEAHREPSEDLDPETPAPEKIKHLDDNIVLVRAYANSHGGLLYSRAELYSPSKELRDQIVGKVPVRTLPSVPLRIESVDSFRSQLGAAEQLIEIYRAPTPATTADVDEFVRAQSPGGYGPPQLVITRDQRGNVEVEGGGLADHLMLYVFATEDESLSALVSEVRAEAEGTEEYRQWIGELKGDEGEAMSRLTPAAEFSRFTDEVIDEAVLRRGALAFIAQHVEALVPQEPTNRYVSDTWTWSEVRAEAPVVDIPVIEEIGGG